jgi:hypothetical protein
MPRSRLVVAIQVRKNSSVSSALAAQPPMGTENSRRARRPKNTLDGIASTSARTPMRDQYWPTAWMMRASLT